MCGFRLSYCVQNSIWWGKLKLNYIIIKKNGELINMPRWNNESYNCICNCNWNWNCVLFYTVVKHVTSILLNRFYVTQYKFCVSSYGLFCSHFYCLVFHFAGWHLPFHRRDSPSSHRFGWRFELHLICIVATVWARHFFFEWRKERERNTFMLAIQNKNRKERDREKIKTVTIQQKYRVRTMAAIAVDPNIPAFIQTHCKMTHTQAHIQVLLSHKVHKTIKQFSTE